MSASRQRRRQISPRPVSSPPVAVILSRAVEAFQSQRMPQALELLRTLQAQELDAGQCTLAGLIHVAAAANPEALTWLDQALAKGGLDAIGYYHRGNLLREAGRKEEAIASYDGALRLNPAYPEALYAGGTLLQEGGCLDDALSFFDEALRLKPDFAHAWFSRGNVLQKQKRIHAAISAYDAALALLPDHPDILVNRGVAFYELGRLDEALRCYETALAQRPDFAQAMLNRANVFLRMRKSAAALIECEAALKLKPDYLEAICSRGVALRDVGRIDEAIVAFDAALALVPDFAHARNNRGAVRLLKGDFENGWEDYEFRWIGGETAKRELKLPLPEWSGTAKPGEHILVFDEQGAGDAIQFSRYLPLLREAGAKVTFFCRRTLHRLLSSLSPSIAIVDRIGEVSDYDCQIALSSLPYVCGTRIDTIPARTPYLFADKARVDSWRTQLGPAGFKIGLCWHGNQDLRADPGRSIPLVFFAPLAAVEGVRLISLQAGAGADQIDELPSSLKVESLGPTYDSGPDGFLDAAAVMSNLDLIVTCDTSIAHLAGALGRPVWLLLKPIPDWRWLLDRADSPWYPSMRLFRRADKEDWPDLLARVAFSLRMQLERRANKAPPADANGAFEAKA